MTDKIDPVQLLVDAGLKLVDAMSIGTTPIDREYDEHATIVQKQIKNMEDRIAAGEKILKPPAWLRRAIEGDYDPRNKKKIDTTIEIRYIVKLTVHGKDPEGFKEEIGTPIKHKNGDLWIKTKWSYEYIPYIEGKELIEQLQEKSKQILSDKDDLSEIEIVRKVEL